MINYQPLQRTLRRKGKSLHGFCGLELKFSRLGLCNTTDVSVMTSTLDKICSALKCSVEEVVSFSNDDTAMKARVDYLNSDVEFSPLFSILACRGISAEQAAEKSRVGRNTFGNIKKGIKPRYATVRRIAYFLGVKPEELFNVKSRW